MNEISKSQKLRKACLSLLLTLFCVITILSGFVVNADATKAPSLFQTATTKEASRATLSELQVRLDENTLKQLATGDIDLITVELYGSTINFHKKTYNSTKKLSNWYGYDTAGLNEIYLTISSDHLFGKIKTPDGVVALNPTSKPYEITLLKRDPKKEVELLDDEVTVPKVFKLDQALETLPAGEVSDDGTLIDVMVLYTDGMAAAHPGALIETRIQYLIDLANLAFTNSAINTQLRLVHTEEVNYVDDSPGGMNEALTDLSSNNGVFSDIEYKRTVYGADQVTLLRTFVDEGCGLAFVIKNGGSSSSYAVSHDGSKTDGSGYFCSDVTYAHELGHNLGSVHDRANSPSTGFYGYSYGYQNPNALFRTIMSYNCEGGCPRITYFSNPNINYQGNPTGISDAEVDSADNAKSMNLRRVAMAAYKQEVEFNAVLKRAELAKYVLQAKHGTSYSPPGALGTVFDDVESGDFNADWVEQLHANNDDITEGCTATDFCSESFVSKVQLAKILLKAKHGPGYLPPLSATGTVFPGDVAIDHPSAAWIETLANEGISSGCATDKYCPNESVSLEVFLSMLSKTFP